LVTVLTDDARHDVSARPDGDALWVDAAQFRTLTGYDLKPEGACRDDVCVPLTSGVSRGDEIDAAGFWRLTQHPVLRDRTATVWLFAESALQRRRTLESLEAPDFTLPDLHGVEHSLSDFRGKKVFLATWASW